MREVQYLLALFLLEILFYITELILSRFSKKNKQLRKVSTIEKLHFIKLNEGYRTSISIFRISIFIFYIILVFLYLDVLKEVTIIIYFMIVAVGILVYMVSLFNIKTFIFYTDYFIVTAPFNFFKKDIIVNYDEIIDFKLYRALYHSYYLKLRVKSGGIRIIQFSGSLIPKNDLVVRVVINTEAGLGKDFSKDKPEKDESMD